MSRRKIKRIKKYSAKTAVLRNGQSSEIYTTESSETKRSTVHIRPIISTLLAKLALLKEYYELFLPSHCQIQPQGTAAYKKQARHNEASQ